MNFFRNSKLLPHIRKRTLRTSFQKKVKDNMTPEEITKEAEKRAGVERKLVEDTVKRILEIDKTIEDQTYDVKPQAGDLRHKR